MVQHHRRVGKAARQVGEPGTAGIDLRKDGRVGGPLGETGAHHTVNDLESEQAVRAARAVEEHRQLRAAASRTGPVLVTGLV